MFNKLLVYYLLFLLASCTSSSKFTFQSGPRGSGVYVKALEHGEYKKIGVTPFNIMTSEIDTLYGGSGPLYVEFRKPGYLSENLIITEMSSLDLILYKELSPESGLEDQKLLNWVFDTMFKAKELVSKKMLEDALVLLAEVKKVVPQIAVLYEFEGGIYYLQKKFKKSLVAYQFAAKYNPKNAESVKMRDFLENKFRHKKNNEVLVNKK